MDIGPEQGANLSFAQHRRYGSSNGADIHWIMFEKNNISVLVCSIGVPVQYRTKKECHTTISSEHRAGSLSPSSTSTPNIYSTTITLVRESTRCPATLSSQPSPLSCHCLHGENKNKHATPSNTNTTHQPQITMPTHIPTAHHPRTHATKSWVTSPYPSHRQHLFFFLTGKRSSLSDAASAALAATSCPNNISNRPPLRGAASPAFLARILSTADAETGPALSPTLVCVTKPFSTTHTKRLHRSPMPCCVRSTIMPICLVRSDVRVLETGGSYLDVDKSGLSLCATPLLLCPRS